MPTFDYRCDCGYETEVVGPYRDADALLTCPQCMKPTLARKISAPRGFILKGEGFYKPSKP